MSRLPVVVCLAGLLVSLVAALPVAQEPQLPLELQEALAKLQLAEQSYETQTPRDKRTIGTLRQLFPGLSQIIDRKIQMITQYLFRVIGRLVLRGGLLGGGSGSSGAGGSGSEGNTRRISITLPTYPPFEEDEEATDTEQPGTDLPDTELRTSPSTELSPEENQLSGSESQQSEVRVQYGDEDQELAASGGNAAPGANAAPSPAAEADSEDTDRNKRLINFGFGASAGTGGSGGGSGNFLFDIIRLVAGSGNTEPSGDSAGASIGGGVAAEAGVVKDDGYQAGVPGPITRLFIIANRGIANLMQDLILRLAQTSERIVNFKARLITAII